MKELLKVGIEVLLIGIVVFFIQKHFENRWAPLTAAETLSRENFLNSKKDAYAEATQLLNRVLANTDFVENGRMEQPSKRNQRGEDYPSEVEINNCFSKLWIYSGDKTIPETYRKIFIDAKAKPIFEMGKLLNLMRNELGHNDETATSNAQEYSFILVHRAKKGEGRSEKKGAMGATLHRDMKPEIDTARIPTKREDR